MRATRSDCCYVFGRVPGGGSWTSLWVDLTCLAEWSGIIFMLFGLLGYKGKGVFSIRIFPPMLLCVLG